MSHPEDPDDEYEPPLVVRGSVDGARCFECPFARMGRPALPVLAEGSERPIWIIVGEGPGHNEVAQGRPFVGQSGRLVSEALARIRVRRESIWVSNATLCAPPSDATDRDKREARRCCAPRLQRELAQFPGRPVAALGAVAAQNFCGEKFSITQMAGSLHEVDFDGTGPRYVIPTTHPAAILRGGSGLAAGGGAHTSDLAFWLLVYDLQKVNQLARGADLRFTDDIEYETTDSARAEQLVLGMVEEIRSRREFACDTETYVDDPKKHSALQAAHAKLNAIGLAIVDRAISVAWNILTPRAKHAIGQILADRNITKWFHNGLYDIPVLNRHGFTVDGPCEDTLLAHHSAFPGLPHDLQRVTTQFYAITPWKAEFRHGEGSLDELLPYNARDTLATMRIAAPLAVAVKKSLAEKTYEVDKAMARAAAIMHVQGVPISREINEQLRVEFKAKIGKARDELLAKVLDPRIHASFRERLALEQARRLRKNDPLDLDERIAKRLEEMDKKPFKFQLDGGDHIVAFLKACGVPLSIQTASGKISTKKDILESFVDYPEVRALLIYRENAKLLNTFVERMFTREYGSKIVYGFADENDRVHPRWSVHKITGRWGSEAPGSQNWPKADKKKGRPNLRSQVVAPPGRALVAFDAKQLEARIIALLSGDPFLLSIFQNDRDIHSEFARIVWPDFDQRPVDERKVLRDMVKRPEYCLVPGTRVLAADLTWRTIETLKPGDALIGFTSSPPGEHWTENYFKQSIVECVKTLRQPCYRIVTTHGEVTASDEHLWVARPQNGNGQPWKGKHRWQSKQWVRTDQLRPGDVMMFTMKPWEEDRSREADARVLSVEPVGSREVVAVQTTTETFIAEGFLSHNCAFYGGSVEAGWKAVVRDYPKVTIGMIGKMVATMATKMPGVTAWHQRMVRMADQVGEVRSAILGRRRCFPLKQFDMSEVVNFPVQSTGADIINLGLMEIMPKLPKNSFPILQIHDAVVFECDEDDQDRLKSLIVECFTREVTYEGTTVVFPVDAKAGRSWAEVN